MWRDTREARRKRYESYLKLCHTLYEPTEALRAGAGSPPSGRGVQAGLADANVCDYVLSPALNGFVLWVLREALAAGKKRLYFLARDGYLMYRTAEILCRELEIDLECRYLCCSRYSLRLPAYHLDEQGAMEYICRGGIDVTPRKILDRAGLTGEEKEEILSEANANFRGKDHREYGIDEIVAYAELSGIREALEHIPKFWQLLEGSFQTGDACTGRISAAGGTAGRRPCGAGGQRLGGIHAESIKSGAGLSGRKKHSGQETAPGGLLLGAL